MPWWDPWREERTWRRQHKDVPLGQFRGIVERDLFWQNPKKQPLGEATPLAPGEPLASRSRADHLTNHVSHRARCGVCRLPQSVFEVRSARDEYLSRRL